MPYIHIAANSLAVLQAVYLYCLMMKLQSTTVSILRKEDMIHQKLSRP
jgi:hypothetical protein